MNGSSLINGMSPSDEEIGAAVREAAGVTPHPVRASRMEPDHQSVVTPELRGFGGAGLRVADASVMPAVLDANINAAVLMIREKATDKDYDCIRPSPGARIASRGWRQWRKM